MEQAREIQKRNRKNSLEEKQDSKFRGKKFECPFVWRIKDELIDDFDLNDDYSDNDCADGFIKLIKLITKAFILCKRGFPGDAMKLINEVQERIWDNYDKSNLRDERISIDVVQHILLATKSYIFLHNARALDAKRLLAHIKCSSQFKYKIQRATLHGCKSIVLSFFYGDTAIETIHHARVAQMLEPNTSLWHFMLGKSLRRLRRNQECTRPGDEEKQAFIQAEQLDSTNPEYAIYVGQMLFEGGYHKEALAKYREIRNNFALSSSATVKMRLALGFMKCKKFSQAKACLDEVDRETSSSKNPMLTFYKGLYWMRKNKFEDASSCFSKAADNSKLLSAYLYALECQNHYIKNFDPVPQLLAIIPIYKKDRVNSQSALLHLGLIYYRRKEIEIALGILLQAIKLNCLGKKLKEVWNVIDGKHFTTYELVLHIWGQGIRNSTKILAVVDQKIYENDNPRCLLKEADIKKILIFCEIVAGKRRIEKWLISVGNDDFIPNGQHLIKFNKNDDRKLMSVEWYEKDTDSGYRKINERTNPIPEDNVTALIHAYEANASTGDNNDNAQSHPQTDSIRANFMRNLSLNCGTSENAAKNTDTCTNDESRPSTDPVHDPEIHKLCPASPTTHSEDSGTGEDNTDAGNVESIEDIIVDNIRIDEIGGTNAGPRNENENGHSADDCAENGNQNDNARNDGDNELIVNDNDPDDNLDNVASTTQPFETVCRKCHKPNDICTSSTCKGFHDVLIRLIKAKLRVSLNKKKSQ